MSAFRRCSLAGSSLLLLLLTGSLGLEVAVTGEATKNRPVTKIINLLKQMLKELEAEAEADEEIYDKLACWCETNDKDKTKITIDAKATISGLKRHIDEW